MRYIPLFILIQAVSLVLTIVGIPVIAVLAYGNFWRYSVNRGCYYFPQKWAYLWNNDEDGACPWWYDHASSTRNLRTNMFVWSALRNPVANLKHVPGVSKVGRPLWYWSNGKHYAKAGWMSNGYPCLSAGYGKGY